MKSSQLVLEDMLRVKIEGFWLFGVAGFGVWMVLMALIMFLVPNFNQPATFWIATLSVHWVTGIASHCHVMFGAKDKRDRQLKSSIDLFVGILCFEV